MKNRTPIIKYEPEADVLSYEISGEPIDYAKEVGNFIIHFTRDNTPVLFEVLEASNFIAKTKNMIEKRNHVRESLVDRVM